MVQSPDRTHGSLRPNQVQHRWQIIPPRMNASDSIDKSIHGWGEVAPNREMGIAGTAAVLIWNPRSRMDLCGFTLASAIGGFVSPLPLKLQSIDTVRACRGALGKTCPTLSFFNSSNPSMLPGLIAHAADSRIVQSATTLTLRCKYSSRSKARCPSFKLLTYSASIPANGPSRIKSF